MSQGKLKKTKICRESHKIHKKIKKISSHKNKPKIKINKKCHIITNRQKSVEKSPYKQKSKKSVAKDKINQKTQKKN